jgi:hypothetical protein
MIISHDYRFIFIKTNKTAGTSIEIALSKFCGPNDVITPISQADEETRKSLGYRGPQNYLVPPSSNIFEALPELFLKDKNQKVFENRKKVKFYNHISAKEIRQYIDHAIWDSYYKFCFERNPWDRMISLYYYRFKSEPRPTITEFLETAIPLQLKRKGRDLYRINDQIVVDNIYRYETLDKELETICTKLGIPEELELPRAKSGFRKDMRNYRDILNEVEQTKIADLFKEEIDLLGYQF